MNRAAKKIISVNIMMDVIIVVFINFLVRFNQKLHVIQEEYSNIIMKALEIVNEPHYFDYFLGGLLAGIILIIISVWDFKYRAEIGIKTICIMIFINIILLIVLLIVYSNPIFTAFAIVVSGAGLYIAAQQ